MEENQNEVRVLVIEVSKKTKVLPVLMNVLNAATASAGIE